MPTTSNTNRWWMVYLGTKSAPNFPRGLSALDDDPESGDKRGTWGSKYANAWTDMRRGDRVAFVIKMSSGLKLDGGLRTSKLEEFQGPAEQLVLARVIRAPYEASTPEIWELDRKTGSAFPYRFDFEVDDEQHSVPVGLGLQDRSVVEAIKESFGAQGRGKLVLHPGPFAPAAPVEVHVEPSPFRAVCDAFATDLWAAGLRFGVGGRADHDAFVRTFLASLATRRFVILTGLSGSGKTQLAKQLGLWLGGEPWFDIVPVRPDWSGPDAMLGYEDSLGEPKDGARPWVVPRTLHTLAHAHASQDRPVLLVLDEMNLAHVERYFADVLSGMESSTGCIPDVDVTDSPPYYLRSRREVAFPSNLLLVGTVNVDETTYMFSPKVLDRANTLEFRIATAALQRSDLPSPWQTPGDVAQAPRSYAVGLLEACRASTASLAVEVDQPQELTRFASWIEDVHRALCPHQLEFGHRVFQEGLRFAALLMLGGESSLQHILDLFVMQKVLPRLHGSKRRLTKPLDALEAVLTTRGLKPDTISRQKIARMKARLEAEHFASFAE